MKAVFDTNIVIDALNGLDEADQEYSRYERVFISRITWMEVMVGASNQDEASVRDFLSTQFEILPVDEQVAEEAVDLRRRHHIRLPDAIIWATARVGLKRYCSDVFSFSANSRSMRTESGRPPLPLMCSTPAGSTWPPRKPAT